MPPCPPASRTCLRCAGLACIYRSLCKAAAIVTVVRVLMYPLRRVRLVRRVLSRVLSMLGYGLSYAICFISIYGLSFSDGVFDKDVQVELGTCRANSVTGSIRPLAKSMSISSELLMSPRYIDHAVLLWHHVVPCHLVYLLPSFCHRFLLVGGSERRAANGEGKLFQRVL